MNPIARGAFGGLAATAAMTGFMYAGKAAGLLHKPPPKTITARAGRKLHLPVGKSPEPIFDTAWLAGHVAYGTASGVAFALLRRLSPVGTIASGLIYGGGLWAISYLGVMPALGLFPVPTETSTSQTAIMIAAHGVYGVVLAEVNSQLE